jgi:hypothetical protein
MPMVLAFEIEHLLSVALFDDPEVQPILEKYGFRQQHRANQVALFSHPEIVAALQNAPQAVKNFFMKAGWGLNRHDQTNFPDTFQVGKFNFLKNQILDIVKIGANETAIRYALFELFDWTKKLALGEIRDAAGKVVPVQGASDIYSSLFDDTKVGIKGFATGSNAAGAIQPYLDNLIKEMNKPDIVDKSHDSNEPMRKEAVKALADAALADGTISASQHRDVLKIIGLSKVGQGIGPAAAGAIVLGADLNTKFKLVPALEGIIEQVVINFRAFLADESGSLTIPLPTEEEFLALREKIRGVFEVIGKHAGSMASSLSDYHKTVIEAMSSSTKYMIGGLGGGLLGDTVEFLNMAYDPIKKGFKEGDWSDFGLVTANYGVAAAYSAVLVIGSVTVATAAVAPFGVTAGAIAGAFVASGWALYGIYDAVINGAELLSKIIADLADVFPKVGDMIHDLADDLEEAFRVISNVLEVSYADGLKVPAFAVSADEKSLVRLYLVDGADPALPDWLVGGPAAEHFYGRNNAIIDAGAGDDEIYMRGVGTAFGGAGDDILGGGRARVVRFGDPIDPDRSFSPKAKDDINLTLDGGAGNDWVIALGGEKAVTIGGNGRDWIFNTSKGGKIYGDTIDGRSPDGTDLEGKENSDNFWWWQDVTIMDAKPNDVLKIFGIPLTGGSQTIPAAAFGPAFGVSFMPEMIGGNNLAAGVANVPMYFDNLVPFMIYAMKGTTLNVVNLLAVFADLLSIAYPGSPPKSLGIMLVKDFEFKSSNRGSQLFEWTVNGDTGDLNMVFKDVNLRSFVALLPPVLGGINQVLPMVDGILHLASAVIRLAKGVNWAAGSDPLVLDLDGDGIETVALEDQKLYFDNDGDFFAERTGWLSGDDGFLVYDRNNNGRIDDATEMFGLSSGMGFVDLRTPEFDSNQDGAITAADSHFAKLAIWQDRDQDGITDAGELKSLSDLAIARIDIDGNKTINVTTPQGTLLRAESSFTRADGSKGAILEAIFEMDDIDTIYRGDKGIAPWVKAAGLNAKGFGEVADLSVVMSNDFIFRCSLYTSGGMHQKHFGAVLC